MSLVPCPECGNQVSTLAEHCPNCGCPGTLFPSPDLSIGDTVRFGANPTTGEALQWRVARLQEGHALLVATTVLTTMPYGPEGGCPWERSDVRAWLNAVFPEAWLSKEERQHVTAVALHNEESADWGTPGGADTEDYCFCMSYQEALRYFTGNAQRAVGTPWWLRTPGIESSYTATVSGFGVINANGQESHTEGIGVLPALWIETSVADR